MKKSGNEELTKVFDTKYIFKGVFISLIISLLACIIVALALFLTPLQEKIVPYAVYIISIFSIIIGAAYAAKRIQVKGWLNGGLTGFTYVVIVLILMILFKVDNVTAVSLISKLLTGFALGALGGIFGLNL